MPMDDWIWFHTVQLQVKSIFTSTTRAYWLYNYKYNLQNRPTSHGAKLSTDDW